jgi:hypothetical protein
MSSALGDRLRAVEVPGEDAARARAAAVTRAAFAERAGGGGAAWRTRSRSRSLPRTRFRPAVGWSAGVAAALAFATLTSPGQAVIDSVRDSLGRVEVRHTPRPALARLPAPGSLLVQSPEGTWVVRGDGSKRLLGPYLDATWSPFGRFVAVTKANALLAVEPGGRVHWSLARPSVSRPRWAPSGFRVAYLSGRSVRVVAGDGTGDRPIGPGMAAEWRTGPSGGVTAVGGQKVLAGANVLAVARADGHVSIVDVDTRQTLWSGRPVHGRVRAMSWSGSGARLLVATARSVAVLDSFGGVIHRIAQPGAVLAHAAFAPAGGRIAIVRRRGAVSELAIVGGSGRSRVRFVGSGRLGAVTWSPDGKWLLVPWPSTDQFLFVPASGGGRVQAAPGVAGEFDPRAVAAPAGAPRPVGWK